MTINKTVLALTAAIALTAGTANAGKMEIAGVRIGNPLDSSTWWEGPSHIEGETVAINFADPEFWMNFADPEQHSFSHTALSDPATWAQMMKPETYLDMMDVSVWAKWFDLDSYDVLLDAQTYAYWAQPGAYGHLFDVEFYTERFNPLAYGEMADAALGNFGLELADVTAALDVTALFGGAEIATVETAPVVTE